VIRDVDTWGAECAEYCYSDSYTIDNLHTRHLVAIQRGQAESFVNAFCHVSLHVASVLIVVTRGQISLYKGHFTSELEEYRAFACEVVPRILNSEFSAKIS
jgi:hypothetical protein